MESVSFYARRNESEFLWDSYFRKNVFSFRTQKSRERRGFVCRSFFCFCVKLSPPKVVVWKDLMEHKIAINTRFSAWLERRQKADWFIAMPVYRFGISRQLIRSVKRYNCAQMFEARDRTLRLNFHSQVQKCMTVKKYRTSSFSTRFTGPARKID